MAQNVSEQVEELGKLQLDFSRVDCFPLEIRQMLGDPAMFSDPRVLAHTTGNSEICRILHDDPASDKMLQRVYPDTNGHPSTEKMVDRLLSRSLSGQALRDRREVCSDWLAEHFIADGKRVVDLGGGSGSYAFKALRRFGRKPAGFLWKVVDKDPDAIAVCNCRADDQDMGEIVRGVTANFMSLPKAGEEADHAVLIGVLCGMDKALAVAVLERAKAHLKPRGEMLAATLLKRAFEEDPLTFRVLCNVGGWQLRPKQPEEVEEIFRLAGWEVLDVFSERVGCDVHGGQYAIVHARTA